MMELDPRKNIANLARPVIRNTQRLGETILREASGLIGVFVRPQDAVASVEEQRFEKIHEDEMLDELERGMEDHETHFKFSQRIFASAVGRLKLPVEELTEEDLLILKRVKNLYEEFPQTAAGVLGLPFEDRSLLLDYLVPDDRVQN